MFIVDVDTLKESIKMKDTNKSFKIDYSTYYKKAYGRNNNGVYNRKLDLNIKDKNPFSYHVSEILESPKFKESDWKESFKDINDGRSSYSKMSMPSTGASYRKISKNKLSTSNILSKDYLAI